MATLPSWRSLMFVPATGERFVAKAHTRGADGIILDLEDSIPAAEKQAARDALAAAAATVGQAGADVIVRVNRPLELCIPDIAAAVMPRVTALMLPKVMGPEHIRLLSEVVAAREAALGLPTGHTRFIGMVETHNNGWAMGLLHRSRSPGREWRRHRHGGDAQQRRL